MNRLKEERKLLKKSQTDIAKKLNISQQAYANYENEVSQPTKEMMLAISKVFNKNVSFLFCFEEDKIEEKSIELTLTIEQHKLIEKIKKLNDTQCIRVSAYTDRLIEEIQEYKNLRFK